MNLSAVSSLVSTDNQSSTDEIFTNDIAFVGICRHLQVEDWYAVDYDGTLYCDGILYPGEVVISSSRYWCPGWQQSICNGASWAKLEVADTQGCNLSPNKNMVLKIEKSAN